MPRTIELSSGKKVNLWITHLRDADPPKRAISMVPEGTKVRAIKVALETEEKNQLAEATAYTIPPDMFCRAKGRKIATQLLIRKLKKDGIVTNKGDLKKIFLAACEEYTPGKSKLARQIEHSGYMEELIDFAKRMGITKKPPFSDRQWAIIVLAIIVELYVKGADSDHDKEVTRLNTILELQNLLANQFKNNRVKT